MNHWTDPEYLKACRTMARLGRENKRDSKEYAEANRRAEAIEKRKERR